MIATCAYFVLMLLLAWLPGKIARRRGHTSAEAIALCGWLGILFPPLWLLGIIWAHTGPDRSAERGGAGSHDPHRADPGRTRAKNLTYRDERKPLNDPIPEAFSLSLDDEIEKGMRS